jgi:TetR/AcrR family transcriptional regulator
VEKKKERKLIIMQSLAGMLEERDLVKITTAELAKRSDITEAAIYKHFPSKRKIYEELVIFFEESIFTRIKNIKAESKPEDVPRELKIGFLIALKKLI